MIFDVCTLYTQLIDAYSQTGVIGRGVTNGAIQINSYNIRDYTLDKHGCVDNYPYGGGAGMLMMAQPVCDCIQAVKKERDIPVIYFTPRGKRLTTKLAKEYAKNDELILLCGHFEGIDERAVKLCVTDEVSIGDYIVTGGHIGAMCFIDCVSRYIPGVLGNKGSTFEESFEHGLLEYKQYTRPYDYKGLCVPDILLSGHHANIEKYKKEQSTDITREYRPDLINDKKNDE